jgi:hypothetical protein
MGRGGYRAGAGRKPGSKKGAEISEETQQIRDMLALKTKAKAKLFNDLLAKIKSGGKVTISEKKLMDVLAVELAAEVNGDKPLENPERLEPLDYMLGVMNDSTADKDRRDRMAIASAPFVHPRIAEGKGKKQEKDEKAAAAAKGRFSAGKPPIALVK